MTILDQSRCLAHLHVRVEYTNVNRSRQEKMLKNLVTKAIMDHSWPPTGAALPESSSRVHMPSGSATVDKGWRDAHERFENGKAPKMLHILFGIDVIAYLYVMLSGCRTSN